MNGSDDFFLKLMKGVSPIKKSKRIKKETPGPRIKTNKSNTDPKTKKTTDKIIKTKTHTKKSEFSLESINIKKNIKKGSFKIDKKIDFHGKTLLESEEQFSNVVVSCYNDGIRCLLFITGKGVFKTRNSDWEDKPKLYHGVIRSALIGWVKSSKFSKYILSCEPASFEDGGDGAFYVYLRKKKN